MKIETSGPTPAHGAPNVISVSQCVFARRGIFEKWQGIPKYRFRVSRHRRDGSLSCLTAWLASCATRDGSSIRAAPGKVIERLNSVEKLRGTDLYLGQIGTRKSGTTPVLVENSLYRLMFQMVRSFPVGPHAVHGWI